MLANNQILKVRINEGLRALEFVLYEYYPGRSFSRPYAVSFEELELSSVFSLGGLLESLQRQIPSSRAIVING